MVDIDLVRFQDSSHHGAALRRCAPMAQARGFPAVAGPTPAAMNDSGGQSGVQVSGLPTTRPSGCYYC